jgi:Signal transduction histidine kinase
MRRLRSKWFGIFWMIAVFLFTATSFAIAYYLTGLLYRFLHLDLPELLAQIINSFLGLMITGAFLKLFAQYFRRQQIFTFQPLIEAMDRIAKGDFSIHLENSEDDGMLRDLTASINKMAAELGQMENMRQEFISNVSHEIQSPLTSIRGFAQALQNDELALQERHHYLQIIESESKRLSRLTEDLLKLASLEADQLKFEPRPFALEKQLRSLILICEPQWSAKRIEMSAELAKVTLDADEDLLNQVWLNLLNNAIKFTPEGGNIKVGLNVINGQAVFTISDNGIGIAPEDRVHIFERFYKADKSRTRAKEGSGLGLAIVKTIVDLHKGSIDVESSLGQGATFTITLPNATAIE